MGMISCCSDSRKFDIGSKQKALKTDAFQCVIKYA